MLRQQRAFHAESSRELQALTQLLLRKSDDARQSPAPQYERQGQSSSLVSQLDDIICALAEQRQDMKDALSLQQDALQLALQVLLRAMSSILVFNRHSKAYIYAHIGTFFNSPPLIGIGHSATGAGV